MESTSLKRKDTTKGPPLRILSLDGGGVRGYSIFIILQEIMHRTFVETEGRAPHRNEIPKPADHFDLIVGTGTGGLIALMLGRLRLDIETCKELYVRLTRMVFETDKTILGIPTRPTLFKASRLEEAIKAAVRDHTIDADEGKDASRSPPSSPASTSTNGGRYPSAYGPRRHVSNASVISFSARSPAAQMARPYRVSARGDPDALLYDAREYRTKTVVTAMFKGSPRGDEPVMLRSYDSRREPAPEFDCRIWEAGRATCAIGLAFKPIQIGQSVFHDDGSGNFNPAPYALDEATVNEWPGREVGVFLSIGTGRRPKGSDQNNPMWYDGFLGDFAEARRRLVAKIEGCEKIHEYVQREQLLKRGVNVENYYRLNVEVGVGEFGMNEWHRLADISTSTKRYLSRPTERNMVQGCAAKLARIHRAKERYNRPNDTDPGRPYSEYALQQKQMAADVPPPLAVELPGDVPDSFAPIPPGSGQEYKYDSLSSPRPSYDSGAADHLSTPHPNNGTPSPRGSSDAFHQHTISEVSGASASSPPPSRQSAAGFSDVSNTPPRIGRVPETTPPGPLAEDDRLLVASPTPEEWRQQQLQTQGQLNPQRVDPPPVPPKTPLPESRNRLGHNSRRPPPAPSTGFVAPPGVAPYPVDDDEAPPPPVNKARKPDYRRR